MTHGQDGLSHAGGLVDVRPLVLHAAHEVTMRVQQRLQSLRLLREDATETERLFRLREPLQNDLHRGAKLLRLMGRRRRGETCHDHGLMLKERLR